MSPDQILFIQGALLTHGNFSNVLESTYFVIFFCHFFFFLRKFFEIKVHSVRIFLYAKLRLKIHISFEVEHLTPSVWYLRKRRARVE